MTIAKYRLMDLIFLGLVAVVVDLIGFFASQKELIFLYVTLSAPIILIIYFRWGVYGFFVNGVIALMHTILYQNFEILPMIGYFASIFALGSAMIWFKITSKSNIRSEVLLVTLYFLTGYLALFITQAMIQLVLFETVEWIVLISRHGFNIILGWVIMMIARHQEDFMVDMKTYLLKQIRERQEEERIYES